MGIYIALLKTPELDPGGGVCGGLPGAACSCGGGQVDTDNDRGLQRAGGLQSVQKVPGGQAQRKAQTDRRPTSRNRM